MSTGNALDAMRATDWPQVRTIYLEGMERRGRIVGCDDEPERPPAIGQIPIEGAHVEIAKPEDLGFSGKRLERINATMQHYVDEKKLAGVITLVARRGAVVHLGKCGMADIEAAKPMQLDTIFRIYSMTKPVTAVALMTLYERGLFSLDDPVHRFIPGWKKLRVRKGGSHPLFVTVPCERAMTLRDLFMHTSGLTYDFMHASNVDAAYRELGVGLPSRGYTLQAMIDQLAGLPLEFSPGERWNYSLAVDVLGYLIEVISGQSLPEYMRSAIFEPLGMVDTSFEIPPDKVDRLASCYERNLHKEMVLQDDCKDSHFARRTFWSGGGGLLSTAGDYFRFCQMLLNGGSLDGRRVIGSRTLQFMTCNHLPGGVDMAAMVCSVPSRLR